MEKFKGNNCKDDIFNVQGMSYKTLFFRPRPSLSNNLQEKKLEFFCWWKICGVFLTQGRTEFCWDGKFFFDSCQKFAILPFFRHFPPFVRKFIEQFFVANRGAHIFDTSEIFRPTSRTVRKPSKGWDTRWPFVAPVGVSAQQPFVAKPIFIQFCAQQQQRKNTPGKIRQKLNSN